MCKLITHVANEKKIHVSANSANMLSHMGQGVILEKKNYKDEIQTKNFTEEKPKIAYITRG